MSWCDAHHITPRSQGGPATLGNLVLLCRRHHRAVHQHGWQLSLDTDTGRVTVRRGGDVFTSDAHAERALRAPPPPKRHRRRSRWPEPEPLDRSVEPEPDPDLPF